MQFPPKFPKAFLARLSLFLSPEDVAATLAAYATERNAAFRVNTLKSNAEEAESVLRERGVRFQKFSALPGAYTVPKEDEYSLKGSNLFYDGKIYVQGITSQLPVMFLDAAPGKRVLDVCAAPGSKTTQIAAIMGDEGDIVALEKSPIRFDKLVHNVRLQGATVECVRSDALPYLSDDAIAPFDSILLDAPCSAEGRIDSNDERSYGFWSVDNILRKSDLQFSLLSAAVQRLRSGGTLVYSTCTLAPEENEGVITRLLASDITMSIEPISFSIPEARSGIASFQGMAFHSDITGTLRVLPSENTEGFYVAKLRKS